MASVVYDIRLVTEGDIPAAVALTTHHFLLEETIYRSFVEHNRDHYRNDPFEVLTQSFVTFLYQTVLKTHTAFIAVNRADNSIMGLVVMHVGEYQNLQYRPGCPNWPTSVPTGLLEKITYYLWDIRENAAVRTKFPEARNHVYFMYLTVHKEHRCRGVGTALLRWGMQWAREQNFDLVCGIFTSVESKKIAERVGMRSIFDCDLRAIRSSKGEVAFADMGMNNIVSVMVIQLKPHQENLVSTTF